MRSGVTALSLVVALGACAGAGKGDGNTDGGGSGNGDGGGSNNGGDDSNPNPEVCAEQTKLVYTVEESNERISKFDPTTGAFSTVGYIDCPGSNSFFKPFGMSIRRDGTGLVLYRDYTDPNVTPKLFIFDTTTLACTATPWMPQLGISFFAMAFSTDTMGGFDDRLFVAGATQPDATTLKLGTLDTTTWAISTISNIAGWAEITGNSDAELWSFVATASPPRIDKLNKATGAVTQTFEIPSIDPGFPVLWSMVTWGGDFWIFLKRDIDAATKVYQIDGTNGSVKNTIDTNSVGIPRSVVGASVSTCAPVFLL
jgi:hypothetical protein